MRKFALSVFIVSCLMFSLVASTQTQGDCNFDLNADANPDAEVTAFSTGYGNAEAAAKSISEAVANAIAQGNQQATQQVILNSKKVKLGAAKKKTVAKRATILKSSQTQAICAAPQAIAILGAAKKTAQKKVLGAKKNCQSIS
jgi:hypothetical protein